MAIACDVERAGRVLHVSSDSTSSSALPTVIVIDNAADMRELLPQYWERRGPRPVGAYWSGLYGHHIVFRADVPAEARFRRVLHEYAHFATHAAHPKPPRWLDEGLSELWENTTIHNAEIELGQPVAQHVRMLRAAKNWIPIEELLSATSLPDVDDNRAAMFYAQSWALVHYLMLENPGGSHILKPLPDHASFPSDQELRQYVAGPLRTVKIPTVRREEPGCLQGPKPRQLSHVDSLVFRAQAISDGERPDAAVPLLNEALRLEDNRADALETLGYVHFVGNRPHQAASVFDRVIAAGKGSHIAYYYRALLAGPIPQKTHGVGVVAELEYLEAALRLNPGFSPARDRLRQLREKFPLA